MPGEWNNKPVFSLSLFLGEQYLASTGNLRDSNDSPYIYSDAAQQHPGSVQKEI
jgi:hypothetical protein